MCSYHGRSIPTLIYHAVSAGWGAGEIRREHSKLEGTFELDGPLATEPGAPSFLIDRCHWLQYRGTLLRIACGVRAGDAACAELAVRFIELHYIGSYSGYIRSKLARSLKSADLNPSQRRRLHGQFAGLALRAERVQEFRDYVRLWRLFITPEKREELIAKLQKLPAGTGWIEWLSARL